VLRLHLLDVSADGKKTFMERVGKGVRASLEDSLSGPDRPNQTARTRPPEQVCALAHP